jgi:hypothetical protein
MSHSHGAAESGGLVQEACFTEALRTAARGAISSCQQEESSPFNSGACTAPNADLPFVQQGGGAYSLIFAGAEAMY